MHIRTYIHTPTVTHKSTRPDKNAPTRRDLVGRFLHDTINKVCGAIGFGSFRCMPKFHTFIMLSDTARDHGVEDIDKVPVLLLNVVKKLKAAVTFWLNRSSIIALFVQRIAKISPPHAPTHLISLKFKNNKYTRVQFTPSCSPTKLESNQVGVFLTCHGVRYHRT